MKALIIGGTGPTGPYIVSGLVDRGYEPVILHRGTHEVDLVARFEHIHADPHFQQSLADAVRGRRFDLIVASYGRLRMVVEALCGISDRLITIGGTVYAKTKFSAAADETAPRPQEHKLVQRVVETERSIREAHEAGRFTLTHLRYPNLYGPRQLAPREWSIVRRLLDGRREIPVMDGGLTLESRAYVENAAQAVLLAIDQPGVAAGQFYNVADEVTPSDGERALAIAAAMGVDVRLVNYPREAARAARFWAAGRNLEYMNAAVLPPTHHKLLDITKIKTELGYHDVVGFEEAIALTTRYYQDHPLQHGSAEEARLGDAFDYDGEDRLRGHLDHFLSAIEHTEFTDVTLQHSYDHPKQPVDDSVQLPPLPPKPGPRRPFGAVRRGRPAHRRLSGRRHVSTLTGVRHLAYRRPQTAVRRIAVYIPKRRQPPRRL